MARADYAHWNEDADHMWWQEEGRHTETAPDPDDFYVDSVGWLSGRQNDYCPCEDSDDDCEFYVDGEFVYRSCTACGCGEGTQIALANEDPATSPRHFRVVEARRWLALAGH